MGWGGVTIRLESNRIIGLMEDKIMDKYLLIVT
ncbi:hypothetical protein B186_018 [Candidatus Portiera aleyrodidarum BT-B-HRs]|nr:hypothetical protein B186_018 [Candidatus Portiera aleyrodidarum BT-B-HRs]